MEKSVSAFTLAQGDAHEAAFQVTEQACQSTQIVTVSVSKAVAFGSTHCSNFCQRAGIQFG